MLRTAVVLALVAGTAEASSISIVDARDATTEGDTTIAVDTDAAYRVAVDFAGWPRVFHDLRSAVVTHHTASDARVTFVHSDGKRDDMHFRTMPGSRTVWFEQTNGPAEVWGEIQFLPGVLRGTTRVHAWLHAAVHGISGAFVSESELRDARHQQVENDLVQMEAYFERLTKR